MIDLTYLKKRGELTQDFKDEKVQVALMKIIPPALFAGDIEIADAGFDCTVKNKALRNWIELIPEKERGFVRFIYTEGDEKNILKYIKIAMTKPAWKSFQSLISKDPSDSDLFLMRRLIWQSSVLKQPFGADFGNYEMNMIFNSLPIDIAKNKLKIKTPSFADFYRQWHFAKWGLEHHN